MAGVGAPENPNRSSLEPPILFLKLWRACGGEEGDEGELRVGARGPANEGSGGGLRGDRP